MLPTDELKNEHRVIERMLRVVSAAADRVRTGDSVDAKLFADAVDFFKNFADKCHHGKEESLLFERMIQRGMPREQGPIAVMLVEHEEGRAHVRRISEISSSELSKRNMLEMVEHIRSYVRLLYAHIQKEDAVLYPMADKMFSKKDQEDLERAFKKVEESVTGSGAHERYHRMVESWERSLK